MGESQISLGEALKNQGMADSVNNADKHYFKWSERAYLYLKEYIITHSNEFMGEDVRNYAEQHGFEVPPSKRAWGAVIRRAVSEDLIQFKKYNKVSNAKAHRANAAVWVKL